MNPRIWRCTRRMTARCTLIVHSVTYRIGPTTGRKVLTLQTLSAIDKPFSTRAGNVTGVSLHVG